MTSRLLRAAVLAVLLVAASARADEDGSEWQFEATVPLEYIGGHTTYEISGRDASSSVRSELQFPIQGVLAGLRARFSPPRSPGGPLWAIEGSAQHTLTEATGTMKDSDWIDGAAELTEVGSAHAGRDIYSTSKAFLRALVVEARGSVTYDLIHEGALTLRLAPLAGVLYQSFSYVVVDVNQVGYGPWAGYSATIGGRGLTYDVAWRAPYVGVRAELQQGDLAGALEGWYSPLANAKDEDDHLLRSKLSKTDADGSAWQARAELRYAVSRSTALAVQGAVLGFSATGTQTQSFYAGPDAGAGGTIGAKLTSLRWTLGAGLSWRL